MFGVNEQSRKKMTLVVRARNGVEQQTDISSYAIRGGCLCFRRYKDDAFVAMPLDQIGTICVLEESE